MKHRNKESCHSTNNSARDVEAESKRGGLQTATMSLYLHERKLKPGSQVTSTSALQTNSHKILFDAFDKIPRIWTQAKPSKKANCKWERSWLPRSTLPERPKERLCFVRICGERRVNIYSAATMCQVCARGLTKIGWSHCLQFTDEEIGAQLVTKQVKGWKQAISTCLFII